MLRDWIDVTVALLAAAVTLYHRVDAKKRASFEADNPRFAACIGMVAALVPFLPMFASHAKALVTGQHPVAGQSNSAPPTPPWSESPDGTPDATDATVSPDASGDSIRDGR